MIYLKGRAIVKGRERERPYIGKFTAQMTIIIRAGPIKSQDRGARHCTQVSLVKGARALVPPSTASPSV